MSEMDKALGPRKPEDPPDPPNSYRRALTESWPKEESMKPEEEADKAQHETKLEQEKAEQEKARTVGAKARAERDELDPGKVEGFSPEQHGDILRDLVAGYITAGIPRQRAYGLALQALNPDAALPQPQQPSGEEESVVKTVLKAVLDDFMDRRKNPPVPPASPTQTPVDPVEQLSRMAEIQRQMGETYMKQVYGLTAEDIAELRNKPEGEASLMDVGANLERSLRLREFDESQRMRWAKFDLEMEQWRAKMRREEKDHEASSNTKKTMEEGVSKLFDAGARALEAASSQARRKAVEETAERTGENPRCPDPECGGLLATGGPDEFPFNCQDCGKSWKPEDVGAQ